MGNLLVVDAFCNLSSSLARDPMRINTFIAMLVHPFA